MQLLSKKSGLLLLIASALLVVVANGLYGPVPQPLDYHDFADKRNLLGISNLWNVLSSVAFAVAGAWGVYLLLFSKKVQFVDERQRWPWVVVSIGLILTGLGSGFYHLFPDNYRLVWDRVPMVIVFMSTVAALIAERIDIRLGLVLWPILVCIGLSSVFVWYNNELRGVNDLRFYVGVQEFAILATLILAGVASVYDRSGDLVVVIALYGLARLFEIYDRQIYMLSKGLVSGHTLKHIAAAMAGIWLMRMLAKRKLNSAESRNNHA